VKRWRTEIGSGEQYVEYSDTFVSGGIFRSYFNYGTVQTFELENVLL
jgi:galactan endo-1,6-beta-galactosidase